jgi:hypothetical protein
VCCLVHVRVHMRSIVGLFMLCALLFCVLFCSVCPSLVSFSLSPSPSLSAPSQLYEYISIRNTDFRLTLKHMSSSSVLDDLTITFGAGDQNPCTVHGFSSSETWYAILDFGTNYCNLHNLATATTLQFTEKTSDSICTQYSSANCTKY